MNLKSNQNNSFENQSTSFPKIKNMTIALIAAMSSSSLIASPLSLSDVATTENLQPNVLFMVDDSGSVDWEVMTSGQWSTGSYVNGLARYKISGDGVYYAHLDTGTCSNLMSVTYAFGNSDNAYSIGCGYGVIFHVPEMITADWRIVSNDFNKVFYNPKITYQPWPAYPDADFTKVRSHPDPSQRGYNVTQNLDNAGFKFAVWHDTAGYRGPSPQPGQATQTPNNVVDLWDNYDLYSVSKGGILVQSNSFTPSSKTCYFADGLNPTAYNKCMNGQTKIVEWNAPFGRSIEEEKQNIANWYQYHRRRSFALRNIVALLTEQFPSFKYGLDFTTNPQNKFLEVPKQGVNTYLHNAVLLSNLFTNPQAALGTPLATALDRAGQYFQGKLSGKASPIEQSCQANYTVMLTDGFWNDQSYYRGQARGDLDGDKASGPWGSTTLADIATYYYQRDLAPALKDNFSLNRTRCIATDIPSHQHMSTIGVTFGPFGNLKADAEGCWPEPALESNENWGNPLRSDTPENTLARIDDLWHAAYNSNGFFTSNANPDVLLEELSAIFTTISQLNIAGAKGTLSSSRLDKTNGIIISQYDIDSNVGVLERFITDEETGVLDDTPQWSTQKLKGSDRYADGAFHLFSYNPLAQQGLHLTEASVLSNAQRQALFPTLNRNDRLSATQSWLTRLEATDIGATVHSNPTYVGHPSRSKTYQQDEVKAGYAEFQASQAKNLNREMIYVGDNRGLLRGIDMATGKEVFSYLPDALMNRTIALENTAYTSRMDGQITAEDVFMPRKGEWRTVIVAGFRYGASGYVALDVTDPESFKSVNGKDNILWEYTNDGSLGQVNDDLGYSYSKAAIGRMANGDWVAAFGNGYNSKTGQSSIIILDIETGDVIAQLNTGKGPANDPLNLNRDNGMAEPILVDEDQDGIVDVIYAGDFYGNLYAFDVTSQRPSQWKTKFGTKTNAQPLYATGGAPITTRPAVMRNPDGNGLVVIIGTGQNVTDPVSNEPANQITGVYDRGAAIASASDLQELTLISTSAGWSVSALETTSDTEKQGWIIPLHDLAKEFKIVTQPVIELGELTVLATKTEKRDCGPGYSTSAIFKLNPVTGTSLNRKVFLDDELTPLDQDEDITDVLVVENTLLVDITLGGASDRNVVIGNTADGRVIELNTTQSPNDQGRQRFQRIYD
ncbi:MAG: PilC/PilY family type IV pilus protein [Pseudomonadota bacterium]|nr:PilC/PilY family type IV pilus protein [Pseudomonadota bacterium]